MVQFVSLLLIQQAYEAMKEQQIWFRSTFDNFFKSWKIDIFKMTNPIKYVKLKNTKIFSLIGKMIRAKSILWNKHMGWSNTYVLAPTIFQQVQYHISVFDIATIMPAKTLNITTRRIFGKHLGYANCFMDKLLCTAVRDKRLKGNMNRLGAPPEIVKYEYT
ncbi:hypothetical protein ACJX0J_041024, partial [Zea mays]